MNLGTFKLKFSRKWNNNFDGTWSRLSLTEQPYQISFKLDEKRLHLIFDYPGDMNEPKRVVELGTTHAELGKFSNRLFSMILDISEKINQSLENDEIYVASMLLMNEFRDTLKHLKLNAIHANQRMNHQAIEDEVLGSWMLEALKIYRNISD